MNLVILCAFSLVFCPVERVLNAAPTPESQEGIESANGLRFAAEPETEEPAGETGALDSVMIDVTKDVLSEPISMTEPVNGEAAQYPRVSANAAVLMDVNSGQICYERAAHTQRPPASTTKIMTAVLAIESELMDSVVTVSEKAAGTGEASLHLEAGQKVLLRELVEGALVRSGNDACVAIAEAVAGDVDFFVRDMNRKAAVLGAVNTRFMNPNGLPNPDHVSTAYDLALMARYALQNPVFAKFVNESRGQFESVEPRKSVDIKNTNKLLDSYPIADGVKTGTTSAAGKCLVASATKDGRRLICVVLDAPDRYGDCQRLLEWGFNNTETIGLGKKGDVIVKQTVGNTEVPFTLTADAHVLVKEGEAEKLTFTTVFPPDMTSVRQGEMVGSYVVCIGEKEVFRCGLLAGADADAPKANSRFKEGFGSMMRRLRGL
ncbi:MAG: D-alanyl-D-alanine carboxypeptidase [Peptococcaceae bacterium]|nr:D-alanyl-D-alanine carboxypeptidase [Peptococcaceae bacterium]